MPKSPKTRRKSRKAGNAVVATASSRTSSDSVATTESDDAVFDTAAKEQGSDPVDSTEQFELVSDNQGGVGSDPVRQDVAVEVLDTGAEQQVVGQVPITLERARSVDATEQSQPVNVTEASQTRVPKTVNEIADTEAVFDTAAVFDTVPVEQAEEDANLLVAETAEQDSWISESVAMAVAGVAVTMATGVLPPASLRHLVSQEDFVTVQRVMTTVSAAVTQAQNLGTDPAVETLLETDVLRTRSQKAYQRVTLPEHARRSANPGLMSTIPTVCTWSQASGRPKPSVAVQQTVYNREGGAIPKRRQTDNAAQDRGRLLAARHDSELSEDQVQPEDSASNVGRRRPRDGRLTKRSLSQEHLREQMTSAQRALQWIEAHPASGDDTQAREASEDRHAETCKRAHSERAQNRATHAPVSRTREPAQTSAHRERSVTASSSVRQAQDEYAQQQFRGGSVLESGNREQFSEAPRQSRVTESRISMARAAFDDFVDDLTKENKVFGQELRHRSGCLDLQAERLAVVRQDLALQQQRVNEKTEQAALLYEDAQTLAQQVRDLSEQKETELGRRTQDLERQLREITQAQDAAREAAQASGSPAQSMVDLELRATVAQVQEKLANLAKEVGSRGGSTVSTGTSKGSGSLRTVIRRRNRSLGDSPAPLARRPAALPRRHLRPGSEGEDSVTVPRTIANRGVVEQVPLPGAKLGPEPVLGDRRLNQLHTQFFDEFQYDDLGLTQAHRDMGVASNAYGAGMRPAVKQEEIAVPSRAKSKARMRARASRMTGSSKDTDSSCSYPESEDSQGLHPVGNVQGLPPGYVWTPVRVGQVAQEATGRAAAQGGQDCPDPPQRGMTSGSGGAGGPAPPRGPPGNPPGGAASTVPVSTASVNALATAPVATTAVLAQTKAAKLRDFSGKGESWDAYQAHFELIQRANHWDRVQAINEMGLHLKEEAMEFYVSLDRTQRENYDYVVKSLHDRFSSLTSPHEARRSLDALKQGAEQSLQALAQQVRTLAYAAFGHLPAAALEEQCIYYYLQAMTDKRIALPVTARQLGTMAAVTDAALQMYESMHACGAQVTKIKPVRRVVDELEPLLEEELDDDEVEQFKVLFQAHRDRVDRPDGRYHNSSGGDGRQGASGQQGGNPGRRGDRKPRGPCHLCKKDVHWANECPRHPDNFPTTLKRAFDAWVDGRPFTAYDGVSVPAQTASVSSQPQTVYYAAPPPQTPAPVVDNGAAGANGNSPGDNQKKKGGKPFWKNKKKGGGGQNNNNNGGSTTTNQQNSGGNQPAASGNQKGNSQASAGANDQRTVSKTDGQQQNDGNQGKG